MFGLVAAQSLDIVFCHFTSSRRDAASVAFISSTGTMSFSDTEGQNRKRGENLLGIMQFM